MTTSPMVRPSNFKRAAVFASFFLAFALVAHHADMPAPLWPSFIEMPVAIDKTLDQKQTKDDEYTYWYN